MKAAILFGDVMQARNSPRPRVFRYRSWCLVLPLSGLSAVARGSLSRNRFNLLSVHDCDHGPRDGSALQPWIAGQLARHGLSRADGEVWLVAMPRVLGYVFNPVSFWFCMDRDQQLRAVLCEVRNTFGEYHNYLLAHADQRPIVREDLLRARKVFYVSPFLPPDGEYSFCFELHPRRVTAHIQFNANDGTTLTTQLDGRLAALTTIHLWRAFFLYPWLTLAVIVRIHLQGLRLWLRRVPLYARPAPPAEKTRP